MWGIDVSHTAHTGAQTGIQHVCRDLLKCFMADGTATPVIHDPYARTWRIPDKRERGFLFPDASFLPPSKRSGKWSRTQKLRGRLAYRLGKPPPAMTVDLLFCPELFDVKRDEAIFSEQWPEGLPRVAYFYDAIPLKFPEWTPDKTVARYPPYLRALALFDHVACISRASERDLHECWEQLDVTQPPPTSAVPLGIPLDRQMRDSGPSEKRSKPVVLMVGTLEARKNHLAVLEASEALWKQGTDFKLQMIGMLNRETGSPAAVKISKLVREGYAVEWEGAVSNERLSEVYATADIFLYPSLYEGFGLPVLEALGHGLPTIATNNGALSEQVEGGGCLVCRETSDGIAEALHKALTDESLRQQLSREAHERPIRNMQDTCRDLGELFQKLGDRPRS